MFNPIPKSNDKFSIGFANFEVLTDHRFGTTNLMSKQKLFFIMFFFNAGMNARSVNDVNNTILIKRIVFLFFSYLLFKSDKVFSSYFYVNLTTLFKNILKMC